MLRRLKTWSPSFELPHPIYRTDGTQESLSSYLYRFKKVFSADIPLIIEELRLCHPTLNKRDFVSCMLDSNSIPIVHSGSGIAAHRTAAVLTKMIPAYTWENHTLKLTTNSDNFATPLKLSRKAGWCQSCLSDWHLAGTPIHWPLTWLTRGYEHCHIHNSKLAYHCEHCGEAKSEFNTELPLEICSYCKTSLSTSGISTIPSQLEFWLRLRSDTIVTRLSCRE